MKLLPSSYTRVTAIGVAMTAAVFTTLVAVAPADASPAAEPFRVVSSVSSTSPTALAVPVAAPAENAAAESVVAEPVAVEAVADPVVVEAVAEPVVAQPVAKPVAKPVATPPTKPVAKPVTKPVTKPVAKKVVTVPLVRTPTSWDALNRAISRIPNYASAAPARWVITTRYGHYGMTDWYHNTIYLSPNIPASQLSSVAKHEYGHILEARAYGGDIPAMITAINRVYGGGGRGNLDGAERAADCIALVNGASWTHYTSCNNPTWRAAARRIIAGQHV